MDKFEESVREALEASDGGLDQDRLESLEEMLIATFKGKTRMVFIGGLMKLLGSLTVTLVASVLFLVSSETKMQIGLAALALMGGIGIMGFSNALWFSLNQTTLLREFKRLELQIARRD